MRSGLFFLEDVSKGTSKMDGYYYFTEDDDHGSTEGQMVSNRRTTIDVDGDEMTYYFKKNGQAYVNTIISSSIYGPDGALITDYGDGSTYERVVLTEDVYTSKSQSESAKIAAGTEVLINGNGKIKSSGTVTDINSQKVRVSNYAVVSVEDDD